MSLKNKLIRHITGAVTRLLPDPTNGLAQAMQSRGPVGELAVPQIAEAARAMACEGTVLLKNEDGFLPLDPNETYAVFGRTAVDYFNVGYGSGGDVIAPYRSSLMDGLKEAGVRYDPTLAEEYDRWCHSKRHAAVTDAPFGAWPSFNPEMPLTEQQVRSAADRCGAALVVIGRAAGESLDNRLTEGCYYLTQEERRMLSLVTDAFDRVCVILNCGNVIDLSWLKNCGHRIKAVLYAWQGGMEAGFALADVLSGRSEPSGRLTDTIPISYEVWPGGKDFGGRDYNNYTEDIFVGYRYFETFQPSDVLYPFGFGLSYTAFEQRFTAERADLTVTVTAAVKNIGHRPGKQVLQVYAALPQEKLGNPERILIAFGKTPELLPGEECAMTMTADLAEFAPFDDTGISGFDHCSVLEQGLYTIHAGTNVRDTEAVLSFELTDTRVVRHHPEAMSLKTGTGFSRLVRRDGEPAFEPVPTEQRDLKERILSALPAELPAADEPFGFSEVLAGRRTAEEFAALLTDEELDDLSHGCGIMNSPLGFSCNAGAFGGWTEQLQERGVPPVITADGPSGLRLRHTCSLLPGGTMLACSFNTAGVEALYRILAEEMEVYSIDMLLSPGLNIHRNPLCGRNFEYYSEDPFLSGCMAAAAVNGIQSLGRSACPKHFACNNQEENRNRNDSRVSERALREIYLKSFEHMLRRSRPKSIMTSYNLVNGVWSHYNYELVTDILRGEWGYDGVVITDWWMQAAASPEFPHITNDAYRIRAGVDVLMPGGDGFDRYAAVGRTLLPSLQSENGVTRGEAQRAAVHVLKLITAVKDQKE